MRRVGPPTEPQLGLARLSILPRRGPAPPRLPAHAQARRPRTLGAVSFQSETGNPAPPSPLPAGGLRKPQARAAETGLLLLHLARRKVRRRPRSLKELDREAPHANPPGKGRLERARPGPHPGREGSLRCETRPGSHATGFPDTCPYPTQLLNDMFS